MIFKETINFCLKMFSSSASTWTLVHRHKKLCEIGLKNIGSSTSWLSFNIHSFMQFEGNTNLNMLMTHFLGGNIHIIVIWMLWQFVSSLHVLNERKLIWSTRTCLQFWNRHLLLLFNLKENLPINFTLFHEWI